MNKIIAQVYGGAAFLILVFGGIQLIALGLIGEYLGRLFLLNNKEPQFIIKNMKTNKKT